MAGLSKVSEIITYKSGMSRIFFSGDCYSWQQFYYNPVASPSPANPYPLPWNAKYVIASYLSGYGGFDGIVQATLLTNERFTLYDLIILQGNTSTPVTKPPPAIANFTTPSFLQEVRISPVNFNQMANSADNLEKNGNIVVGMGYGNYLFTKQTPTSFFWTITATSLVIQYYKPTKQNINIPITTNFTLNMNVQNCLQFQSDFHSDLNGSLALVDNNTLNIPKIQFVSGNKNIACPNP